MVNFSKMRYSSLDEYSDEFLDTLLESNHTYEFYVNWDKDHVLRYEAKRRLTECLTVHLTHMIMFHLTHCSCLHHNRSSVPQSRSPL